MLEGQTGARSPAAGPDASDLCTVHCQPQVSSLKSCIDAQIALSAASKAPASALQSPMVACIPFIQSWKDCCEEAKFKFGNEGKRVVAVA